MSTNTNELFERFPSFIQDYIYSHSWEQLREVQIAAANTLFKTNHNLLLTTSTASGKTEAAFFPILTDLYENPSTSVGVMYIAPLKSLINDQFLRLEELLEQSGVNVTHWHGDVAQSHKKKLLENPSGLLQITPESLEAMLINRSNDIPRLFGDLRYVVIDEIHTLTGTDRGNQIICQLIRIARLIGHSPRRIGLSATIGDPHIAAAWLGAGTQVETDVPIFPIEKIHWRLGMEHFYIQNLEKRQAEDTKEKVSDNSEKAELDAGYEYMYDCVNNKKALVFSNSREETEYLTATFRQIAKRRGEPDKFLIHHGNLSSAIREEAEIKLKNEDERVVTCATVTMELGIDIGHLERILQSGSPTSVMSFLQRLGRSGRRGQPPEMMLVFREEDPLPNTPLPQLMPWDLLRAIAIVQLYIEERFIEPPIQRKLPFSLAFHQTLSILAGHGEMTSKQLAETVLSMPTFESIPSQDYRTLLVSMLNNDFIEMTEEKGLIVGLRGEQLLKSFKFYAVFKDSDDYTVRCGSDEIGTITTPPPVGDRFALAGRVWEVEELDIQHKLIYVNSVDGKMEISWPGDYGEIHTRIQEKIKEILTEDKDYPYLKDNAKKRIEIARHIARNTGMLTHSLVHLGGYSWCLFPWLGTRSFRTLRRYIQLHAKEFGITNLDYEGCNYMTFRMEKGSDYTFTKKLNEYVTESGIDCNQLVFQGELPIFNKYDDYIPAELLRKAFSTDRLRADEAENRIQLMANEY